MDKKIIEQYNILVSKLNNSNNKTDNSEYINNILETILNLLITSIDKGNNIGEHYKKLANEPINVITHDNLDFCLGNILKYIVRYNTTQNKNDLIKAHEYIKIYIKDVVTEHRNGISITNFIDNNKKVFTTLQYDIISLISLIHSSTTQSTRLKYSYELEKQLDNIINID